MVLANFPKGLPILNLSIALDSIPSWKERNPKSLNILFLLYNLFLDDDATFFIFYLDDPNILRDIMGYFSSNNFKIHQKWWVVNIEFKLSNTKILLKWFFFHQFLCCVWFNLGFPMQNVHTFHFGIKFSNLLLISTCLSQLKGFLSF